MIKMLVGRLTKLPTHPVPVLGITTAISADDASFQLAVWNIRIDVHFCDWDTCKCRFLNFLILCSSVFYSAGRFMFGIVLLFVYVFLLSF